MSLYRTPQCEEWVAVNVPAFMHLCVCMNLCGCCSICDYFVCIECMHMDRVFVCVRVCMYVCWKVCASLSWSVYRTQRVCVCVYGGCLANITTQHPCSFNYFPQSPSLAASQWSERWSEGAQPLCLLLSTVYSRAFVWLPFTTVSSMWILFLLFVFRIFSKSVVFLQVG